MTISDKTKATKGEDGTTPLSKTDTVVNATEEFLKDFGDGNGWKDKDKGGEVRVVLTETDVSK